VTLFELENDNIILQTGHDFQGYDFVWYDNPVDHFDLTSIQSRVTSFQQLKYYAEVLFYLNPDIDYNIFQGLFRYTGTRESGKCIRTYSKARIDQMTEEVYKIQKHPYCRRTRRIMFNPEKIISHEEKLAISSHIIKRGLAFTKEDVERVISQLSDSQRIITGEAISKELLCSRRTVSRIIDDNLKKMIQELNKKIRREQSISKAIEWIDVLSDSGDGMKMQDLKKITNIRDYSIIKEAMSRYEKLF
jgi:hypothetical protein